MDSGSEYQYFINFPHRNLVFKVSRRGLVQMVVLEYEVVNGMMRGGKEYKLSQLGALPNEQLFHLKPAILDGCSITTQDNFVWGQLKGSTHPQRLFLIEPATLSAFNCFNGQNNILNVGRHLAHQMNWPKDQAVAFVRGLFLHLVQLRVCLPQG